MAPTRNAKFDAEAVNHYLVQELKIWEKKSYPWTASVTLFDWNSFETSSEVQQNFVPCMLFGVNWRFESHSFKLVGNSLEVSYPSCLKIYIKISIKIPCLFEIEIATSSTVLRTIPKYQAKLS